MTIRRHLPRIVLLATLAAAPGACGAGDASGVDEPGGADAGAPGSCDDGGCLELSPPPAGAGFQVVNVGATIQPGEDVEYCEVVRLPGTASDTYYVNRFESAMTAGSHHLIVAAIEPGSATDANAQVGDRVECFGASSGFGGDLLDVTGQQLPYHEESFPDGVGRVYTGGQKLVFDYHYLNASDAPLPALAKVNFYTTEEAAVQKIAEGAGFRFVGIDIEDGAQASYTVACAFDTGVMVHKLTRHTHQWGTDFDVSYAGGARDGELIFSSPSYEVPDHVFDQPVAIAAGDGFRFTCNYHNTSGHHLGFGENATDEMCILFATIYSPTEREVPGDQGCRIATAQ